MRSLMVLVPLFVGRAAVRLQLCCLSSLARSLFVQELAHVALARGKQPWSYSAMVYSAAYGRHQGWWQFHFVARFAWGRGLAMRHWLGQMWCLVGAAQRAPDVHYSAPGRLGLAFFEVLGTWTTACRLFPLLRCVSHGPELLVLPEVEA